MTDPDVNRPLSLPPAAAAASLLKVSAPLPHLDSEAFLQGDRHRTVRELEDINHGRVGASRNRGARGSTRSASRSLRRRPSESGSATNAGPRYRQRRPKEARWHDPIVRFWRRNVNVEIDEGGFRDHLALERTFLAYLRTSLALVMTGVIIAQLFRLQHRRAPDPRIGYFVLGVPLASTFVVCGIVVLALGAVRFWRQQGAIVRGKVYAGGWEVNGTMGLSLGLCAVAFGLLVWVDVDKG